MAAREMRELGHEECRRLLSSHYFGRLAFLDRVGVLPMITPVNYGFVDDAVVLRSDEGSKFRAAVENAGAAFEIDGVDDQQQVGWSVVVCGRRTSGGKGRPLSASGRETKGEESLRISIDA